MPSPLIQSILESFDWSTSTNTCIVCVRRDLEGALKPIVESLKKNSSHKEAHEVAETLEELYSPNLKLQERVFTDEVSVAANEIYRAGGHLIGTDESEARAVVRRELKSRLEPVSMKLDAMSSLTAKHAAKMLRELYEE